MRRRSFISALKCAFRGAGVVFKTERNFRTHAVIAALVVLYALLGGVETWAWALIFVCFGIVTGAEAFNSAIERLCAGISEGFDKRVKDIKDIASGAVLLCACASACAGLFVFLRIDILLRFAERPFETAFLVIVTPIAVVLARKTGKKS